MKKKITTIVCTAAIGFATSTPAFASSDPQPAVVCADALVMRPVLFASTVAGSALFVVCLPFAALSKSVKSTARALVVAPAQATFTRPLGDFDYHDAPDEMETAAAN
jgi:hypothetical protein